METYDRIRRYHRNVALWLAPPEKQMELSVFALWRALDLPEIKESLDLTQSIHDIGRSTIPFLSSLVGSVVVRSWWSNIEARESVLDFLTNPSKEIRSVLPILDEFMLGGILRELMFRLQQIPNPSSPHPFELLESTALLGLERGLEGFKKYLRGLSQVGHIILNTLG